MKKKFLSISFIVYLILLFPYSNTMANEEPPYKVVHKTDIYEVRHYSDRLVVQVIKTSDNRSFRQLFNYISGGNGNAQKIEMTVPVTQTKKDNKLFMQFFLLFLEKSGSIFHRNILFRHLPFSNKSLNYSTVTDMN